MSIVKEVFGTTSDGVEIMLFKMKNKNGMEAQVINYGAVLLRLYVPDAHGNVDDVVLGYDTIAGYEVNGPGFGAFIGRNSNRIEGSSFTLNGVTYELDKNEGENNLHGGFKGYSKMVYEVTTAEKEGQDEVTFSRVSPHMEQGFPGNLTVDMTYILTDENELILQYNAVSDQDTIVNFTNHSYFNLAGHNSGSVLHHMLKINSSKFTITDEYSIPTGEYVEVEGTPMDFREYKTIGKEIEQEYAPLVMASGYDHNYVLEVEGKEVVLVAEVVDPKSGRCMEVYTNKPGIQLYTANYLKEDGFVFKDQAKYQARDAVCLETQFYPNACNMPEFPSPVLRAGEEYDYTTIYKFS